MKGYIVSQANVKTCEPLLFLVAWDIIKVEKQHRKGTSLPRKPNQNVQETVQAGKAAHFLQHWAMVLSNADLAGGNSSWHYPRHSSAASSVSSPSPLVSAPRTAKLSLIFLRTTQPCKHCTHSNSQSRLPTPVQPKTHIQLITK